MIHEEDTMKIKHYTLVNMCDVNVYFECMIRCISNNGVHINVNTAYAFLNDGLNIQVMLVFQFGFFFCDVNNIEIFPFCNVT